MAPKTSKSTIKAKKVVRKTDKKKRSKKRAGSYKIYIFKVLKQVHPDTAVSSKAMSILNSFATDVFERIASEASKLMLHGKSKTLTAKEIQSAVRLVLPGELSKHASSEGTKAVNKFSG